MPNQRLRNWARQFELATYETRRESAWLAGLGLEPEHRRSVLMRGCREVFQELLGPDVQLGTFPPATASIAVTADRSIRLHLDMGVSRFDLYLAERMTGDGRQLMYKIYGATDHGNGYVHDTGWKRLGYLYNEATVLYTREDTRRIWSPCVPQGPVPIHPITDPVYIADQKGI